MTLLEQLITIGMIVLGTVITRFLPFVAFPAGREKPSFINYLGKALPSAVFGLLIVYCLKNINVFESSHGLPDLISILLVILVHLWKRKMLFSIAAGTVCYMLLVQLIF